MLELALNLTSLVGSAALLVAGIVIPALFLALVLMEQLQGLRRAEAETLVPTAWKRALAGGWSLRGRIRLPRRSKLH